MAVAPPNPDFEAAVRESFSRQAVMATIGASLERVAPGEVEIALPFRADLTQQDGYLHAAIVAAILDSACGYSAMSLVPAGAGVLTVEFKANFVAPARGERFVARARTKRAGRTLTVAEADAFAAQGASEVLVATMLATIMTVEGSGRRRS